MFKFVSLALAFAASSSIALAQANPDVPLSVNGNTATIPVELDFAYGNSLPGTKAGDTYVDPDGPSRMNGGERISIRFRNPKAITALRLTAYSKSGLGKVLVRNAVADSALMPELFKFSDAKNGQPENYKGLVMLNAGSYIESTPNRALQNIEVTVEGFANNDSTILVELNSAEGFAYSDFVIRRSRTGEQIGGFFDEAAYKTFTPARVRRLMRLSQTPTFDQLNGTTWVCSSYAPNLAPSIDLFTRRYFSPAPGVLQSTSDKNGQPVTWILTQEGWKLPLDPDPSTCGPIAQTKILRFTPAGNLVAENVIDRDAVTRACLRAGFPLWQINDWIARETLPSVVNNRYNTRYYDFCRPAKI